MLVHRVPEIECIGGPFDGSLLSVYAPECRVKVLADSPFSYRYVLTKEDDGTKFWLFAGIIESVAA